MSKSSKRATDIHRFGMAKATIPVEQPRLPPVIWDTATLMYDDSYVRRRLTFSQEWKQQNEYLCLCEVFQHCDKQATLHQRYCNFCYGEPPGGCPKILRYYPCDEGWWTLRHQVKRLRQVSGIPDFEEILPVPNQCGCAVIKDEQHPGRDIQVTCHACK